MDYTAENKQRVKVFYENLASLFKGDERVIDKWLHTYNHELRGVPVQLVTTEAGFEKVYKYIVKTST